MSAPARINLVRVSTLAQSEGLDGTASNHDEIELVNDQGEAASMIYGAPLIDNDVVYEYHDGSIGVSPKLLRHQIMLSVDYVTGDVRAKLERWKRDRALIRFCPGFGRDTEIAFRPIPGIFSNTESGAQLRDLTGRWLVWSTGEGGSLWDPGMSILRGPYATNERRVVRTPAGSGQALERSKNQRQQPTHPLSNSEGHGITFGTWGSGWRKGGAHSADLTFEFVSNGFGALPYNNALRVTADNAASRNRYLYIQTIWDSGEADHIYTFTGSQRMTMSVWLKGRVGAGATLHARHGIVNTATVNLDGIDLSQWTKVSLDLEAADWSTNVPIVMIDLTSGATPGGNPNLLVGPCVVYHSATNPSSVEPELPGVSVVTERNTVNTFRFPSSGSMMCSFWWPEGSEALDELNLVSTNASGSPGRLYIEGTTAYFVRAIGATVSGTIDPNEGAVNTLCVTWKSGNEPVRLYFNGQEIGNSGTARSQTMAAVTTTLSLGVASWPLVPLTWRIDNRVWTDQDVAEYDTTLRDRTCNQVAVMARGRQYRIETLPNQPRNQQGGVVWTGDLVLVEHQFDSDFADIISDEL